MQRNERGKREETREYRGGSEQLDFYGRQIIKAAADPSDGGGVLKRCTRLLEAIIKVQSTIH